MKEVAPRRPAFCHSGDDRRRGSAFPCRPVSPVRRPVSRSRNWRSLLRITLAVFMITAILAAPEVPAPPRAAAYVAPWQDVQVWLDGNKFHYKVYDRLRDVWAESYYSAYSAELTWSNPPQAGIVAVWERVQGTIFYATYDAGLGRWQEQGPQSISAGPWVNWDGVVAWIPQLDGSRTVRFATYDAGRGSWQSGSWYNSYMPGSTIMAKNGVVAWTYSGNGYNGFGIAIYDPKLGSWRTFTSSSSDAWDTLDISQATLTWTKAGVTYTAGYDPGTGQWYYGGPTKPLAWFAASATSGNPPFKVVFTDMPIRPGGFPTWEASGGNYSTNGYLFTFEQAGVYTVTWRVGSSEKSITNVTDFEPPHGSINNAYANSNPVILQLSATDDSGSVASMRFSNDGSNWSGWEPYATTRSWSVSAGDGVKTVYAQFKDVAGNVSGVVSRSLILDTTPPNPGTMTATPGDGRVFLDWSGFSDQGSGISYYEVATGLRGVIYSGSNTEFVDAGLTAGDFYFYYVFAYDNAGWASQPARAEARVQSAPIPNPPVWVAYAGDGDFDDWATAIAVDASGNVYVTGTSLHPGFGGDYLTFKYNNSGVWQWQAYYNNGMDRADTARAIAVDASGNVYVTGASRRFSGTDDYTTVKYNSSGVKQWETYYYYGTANGYDSPAAVAVDGSGNVYVTGSSEGGTAGDDYATVKYNSSGAKLWATRYNGPASGSDRATAMFLDGSGNVYVTGYSAGAGSGDDYVTIKYDTSSGNQQWIARYNGPGNGDDRASGIALDGSGNVYVTGSSLGIGTGDDYTTIKYNSSGLEMWAARYNGPGNGRDAPSGIGLDGTGNVYVTGASAGAGSGNDYATIKYNSSGNEQWVRRYNGPGNGEDTASAIVVDAAGNVYATGSSYGGSGSGMDYATIWYDTGGVQQWAARYRGLRNSDDRASAIALDSSGYVYVTGQTFNSKSYDIPSGLDFTTLKYVPSAYVRPVASFTKALAPASGAGPTTVAFTDTSTNFPVSWSWNFGDGSGSSSMNPTKTYSTPGNYAVTLTAGNSAGQSSTSQPVSIYGVPVAGFTENVSSGNAPLTVIFTDASTGNILSWSWSFGDGTGSSSQNPTKTYTGVGNYTVTLTVTNPAGSSTATAVKRVYSAPAAGFTRDPAGGPAPLTVSFTDRSSGNIYTWLWSFGDGSTSSTQNPTKTYTSTGNYTVTLTAGNPAGSSSTSLPVTVYGPPVAGFTRTLNPPSGVVPNTATFTDTSTNFPATWSWAFGDGTGSSSQNPVKIYTAPGNYTVTLTASNPAGSSSTTQTVSVYGTPVASFTENVSSGVAPLAVNFTDTSTGNIVSWLWSFGDGTSSASKNPTKTYTSSGNYTVTLTVTNPAGSSAATAVKRVYAMPSANFTASATWANPGAVISFTDQSSGNITGWSWGFGDGTGSSSQNLSKSYSSTGNYTVSLTASNPAGSNTLTRTAYINITSAALALTADTALAPDVAGGYAVVRARINRLKNGAEVFAISDGIGGYDAYAAYDAAGVAVVGVDGEAGFGTPTVTLASARTDFSASGGAPLPPADVARLRLKLTGSAAAAYTVTLNFNSITRTGGGAVTQSGAATATFRRGDANSNGTVDMTDALFIAQYRVGIRGLGTDTLSVNAVNAASVKPDDATGDRIDMNDALYIAQFRVQLRDESFNWK
ncbi:MAG: PKD domain-containing protein [Chloroflexi bacterium]|nr:PKD domain-containing protein [Chloroflexota bacterium]